MPAGADLRLEHLDPADHVARRELRSGPENFIGIHFFSPVERMMLVEIILGKKTGDAALARRARLRARHQQDADRRQRHARLLRQPLRAALYARRPQMLIEGVPAAMIENVARMAGMPVGPLALNDETAIDLAQKIMKADQAATSAKARRCRRQMAADRRAWSTGTAASAARTARASTTIRRSRRRSGSGRASQSSIRRRSIRTRSTSAS